MAHGECPACFEEQKHLDQGSSECTYWDYGYMVALLDVLRYLTERALPTLAHGSSEPDKRKKSRLV